MSTPPVKAPEAGQRLRDSLSHVPTPVTVVTLEDENGWHGSTVGSFASLSAEPPLVMAGLDLRSEFLGRLSIGDVFGVNVLAAGQEAIARTCATKGPDKLAGLAASMVEGAPRIDGIASWFLCRAEALLPGGDHEILVGRVLACERWVDRSPLVYHLREFTLPHRSGS